MSKLTEAVEAKLAADGVTATAAAKSVGLSLPSFRAVLKGKSVPNARGLKKYAQLLGISNEEAAALVGGEGEKPRRGRKAGKGKGKGKAKKAGKPGRKPGKGKAKKAGKPGRKPGRKPGKKSVAGSGVAAVLGLLSQAEEILGDDLAVAVHGLGKAQRATIEMIVKSLG
jgi:hypothetical protein